MHNIGFEADATHTHTKWDQIYAALIAEDLDLPLVHPSNVLASSDLDELEARLRATYHSKGLLYVTNKYLELKVLIARAMRHAKSR